MIREVKQQGPAAPGFGESVANQFKSLEKLPGGAKGALGQLGVAGLGAGGAGQHKLWRKLRYEDEPFYTTGRVIGDFASRNPQVTTAIVGGQAILVQKSLMSKNNGY